MPVVLDAVGAVLEPVEHPRRAPVVSNVLQQAAHRVEDLALFGIVPLPERVARFDAQSQVPGAKSLAHAVNCEELHCT
jgi:hypothetical protein